MTTLQWRERPSSGSTLPLCLTLGDPAGIGPEITIKALDFLRNESLPPIVVIGDLPVLEMAASVVAASMPLKAISSPAEACSGAINVLHLGLITPNDFHIGQISAACGRAAFGYIMRAIELATSGQVSAVITNPINKQSIKAAGIDYAGHTEIFARQTSVNRYSMMFLLGNVAVVHVTTHCSLRQAIELVNCERVLDNIRLLHYTLLRLGFAHPRIAVAGLNPHAGENGLFGDEELLHINPAVAAACAEGIDAFGPLPVDSVFMRAFRGDFEGVVSMLHDHGFVALKTKNFNECVNITVGLPIVRTSVGHGTAFDIAGRGIASEKSLVTAIRTAHRLSTSP